MAKRKSTKKISTDHNARSQASLIEESRLRVRLEQINQTVNQAEEKIVELEIQKTERAHQTVAQGLIAVRDSVSAKIDDILHAREILKDCEHERAVTEAAIETFNARPAPSRARLKLQRELRRFAVDRLEKDRQADRLLKELRQVLNDRKELSDGMEERSADLGLKISEDGLDMPRFETFSASLPDDFLSASEHWHAWFLGERKDIKPYVVRDEYLVVRETLVDHGVYQFGELIHLTEEESAELLCEEFSAPISLAPWHLCPPSVMTLDVYKGTVKAAKEKGISAQEMCFWQDVERDVKAKERFDLAGGYAPKRPRTWLFSHVEPFASTVKIKGRAKIRIFAGREYQPGDVIEAVGKDEAWRLASIDSIGPL